VSDAVELRRAGPADAEAIAGVSVRTWHHAYGDFIDPRTLFERTVEQQLPLWQERLDAGADGEIWVAMAGGRVVAYTAVGPSGDDDATAATGSLRALYVDPPAQGAGLGAYLHDHALMRLQALGFPAATLWSFAKNEQARTFYEHRGWLLDPSGAGQEGADWLDASVRYARAV
jgi:GNAT superfamily N-acetyltransferase